MVSALKHGFDFASRREGSAGAGEGWWVKIRGRCYGMVRMVKGQNDECLIDGC